MSALTGSPTLDALIAEVKRRMDAGTVSPDQMPGSREQMISFVYGNLKIENDAITREVVERAVDAHFARSK